jgi:hypothetical protein
MGLWWKQVKSIPNEGMTRVIIGDRTAWKKEDVPLLWRWQHKWALLRVSNILGGSPDCDPYQMYFTVGDSLPMQYRFEFKTEYVLVRVGHDDTKFYARDAAVLAPRYIADTYQRFQMIVSPFLINPIRITIDDDGNSVQVLATAV